MERMDVCWLWNFINYKKLEDTEAGTFPRKETYEKWYVKLGSFSPSLIGEY